MIEVKVAVLGCGPAGLMAMHGVTSAFVDHGGHHFQGLVRVFSKKRKSRLFGAQYLHQPIPGASPEGYVNVDYQLRGDTDQYRRKVYGRMWDGSVSPEDYTKPHAAWDIRATYDRLWEFYEGAIVDTIIDPPVVRQITEGGWDFVINTIPRDMLCFKGHVFGAQEIIAAGDAPELGIDIGKQFRCDPNTVICNGEESPSWYRMSNIFGHTTVEWPLNGQNSAPVTTAQVVRKPTHTDCDCWPDILHLGRYGSWRKGVLSHEAYKEAYITTFERMKDATREAAKNARA